MQLSSQYCGRWSRLKDDHSWETISLCSELMLMFSACIKRVVVDHSWETILPCSELMLNVSAHIKHVVVDEMM